jgi:hypothetical protein
MSIDLPTVVAAVAGSGAVSAGATWLVARREWNGAHKTRIRDRQDKALSTVETLTSQMHILMLSRLAHANADELAWYASSSKEVVGLFGSALASVRVEGFKDVEHAMGACLSNWDGLKPTATTRQRDELRRSLSKLHGAIVEQRKQLLIDT